MSNNRLLTSVWLCVVYALGSALPVQAGTPMREYLDLARTDFAVAGVGGIGASQQHEGGAGVLELQGVSGTVTLALLYWNGIDVELTSLGLTGGDADYDQPDIRFDGVDLTGSRIASSGSNDCWDREDGTTPNPPSAATYRADVTALVQTRGNGAYAFSGLSAKPGHSPNGLSLIVYFDDGNPGNDAHVLHYEGQQSNTEPMIFTFPIDYVGGRVEAVMHVSDGQAIYADGVFPWRTTPGAPGSGSASLSLERLYDGQPLWPGTSVPTMGHSRSGTNGLWDIRHMLLTPMYGPRGHYVTSVTYGRETDCVSLQVAQIVQPADPQASAISPNPYDFGDIVVGQTSATQRFTITNLQPAPTTMTNPTVAPSPYTIVAQTCNGAVLPTGGTCTVDVRFSPASAFLPLAGALTVRFTDATTGATPIAIYTTLRGAGVTTAMFTRLQIEPVACQFPTTSVGATSAPIRFRARNTGNLSLTISNTRLAGGFAENRYGLTATDCNGQTLDPGTSCMADLVFHPTSAGLATNNSLMIDYSPNGHPGSDGYSELSGRGSSDLLFAHGFEEVTCVQ